MMSKELGDWADRPVALPHAVSPSPPLRGRCRRQGGPCLLNLSGRRQPTPPLCHSVTSPTAGGRWERRTCISLRRGERGFTICSRVSVKRGLGIWTETLFCDVRILLCSPTAEAEGVGED